MREAGIQYSLLFPARLRVILEGHTTFLQTPEEAWKWLETYMAEGNTGTQLGQALRQDHRRVRRKLNRSHPRMRPTPAQKELDRQAALEAAALLQWATSADEVSRGESDHQSYSIDSDSHHSDAAPQVTPWTADDLC
ncbi:hypothetical protein NDU88_003400 [Pleurodeles waltl]|uniref:Uncharacterized protein n=1 Tax=Pleurodeles waltl TaxID=8319 RepID=A0AAV7SDD7_PLEWA|nr:hypothetical protein NDU88_003400 [Pleurodeles waltl]